MVNFKNNLDEMLADVVLSSGLQRQIMLDNIRKYLASTNTITLQTQIGQITSLPELSILQGVGVPRELQSVFLSTVANLQG